MNLGPHTLTHSFEQGAATGKDNVLEEVLAHIHVTFLNGIVAIFMNTLEVIETSKLWAEQDLSSAESLVTNQNLSAIWELIVLFACMALLSLVHSGLEVVDDIAHLLLDITNDLDFGVGSEGIATLVQDFLEISCYVPTGKLDLLDGMWNCVTLKDWDGMGDTITRVEDNTGRSTVGVESEDGLDTHVEAWYIEDLEHDLSHLFSVFFWVEWSLGHEDWMLLWRNLKFTIEGMMPHLLHIVPVSDDAVLNWMSEPEHTPLLHSLITHINLILIKTNHNSWYLWPSYDGAEHSSWRIISSKTGLADARSIVDDHGGYFFFHSF